jgi:PadR family transcriptional regulator, regulatory protein PadR
MTSAGARRPRMTIPTQLVLGALLADPGQEMYGLQICAASGLPSGTVHPILARLEDEFGWLASRWEDVKPKDEGRPRRRYYQLTESGAGHARAALARSDTIVRITGATIMRDRLQMNGRDYRMTENMRAVLAAVVDGGGQAWGHSICEQTALGPASVYPALDKLMGTGVITDRWEDPVPEERPRRRFYDSAFDPSWYVTNGLLPETP